MSDKNVLNHILERGNHALTLSLLNPTEFENVCGIVIPNIEKKYSNFRSNLSADSQTRSGNPDAHCYLENGRYAAFIMSTLNGSMKQLEKKFIEDIRKLKSDDCPISERIHTVVICSSRPIGSIEESLRKECEKYNWTIEVYDSHHISRLIMEYGRLKGDKQKIEERQEDKYSKRWLIGKKLQIFLIKSGLTNSKMYASLPLGSEIEFNRILSNEIDAEERIVRKICNKYSLRFDWFIYSEGDMLNVPWIDIRFYEKFEKENENLLKEASNIYFCMSDTYSTMIIIKDSNEIFHSFILNVSLDFWNWVEDFEYTLLLKRFYETISKYSFIYGIRLPDKLFNAISSGEIYGSGCEKFKKHNERYWFADLFNDLDNIYFREHVKIKREIASRSGQYEKHFTPSSYEE